MLDLLFELRPQLTLAEDDEPDVGDLLDDDGRRLDQRVVVLLSNQRANGTDDRRVGRQEQCRMEVAVRQRDDTFDVDALVHNLDFRWWNRSATRRSRTARLMARKQSTCEHFQAEKELRAIGNSMRREATSIGRGRGAAIESAAAIATAFGSWACTTSGRSCLSTRDRRQAAARSISPRDDSGTRSSPSDMRWKSAPSGSATSAAR